MQIKSIEISERHFTQHLLPNQSHHIHNRPINHTIDYHLLQQIELDSHEKHKIEQQATININKFKTIKYILTFIYIVFCLTIIASFWLSKSVQSKFIDSMHSIQESNLFTSGCLLILIGIFIIVFGLPLTIYELVLGFTTQNLLQAFVIDFVMNSCGFSVAYFLSRKLLLRRIHLLLDSNIYLASFNNLIAQKPLVNLIMLRLLNIPVLFKNYVFPLLNVNYKNSLIAALVSNSFYGFQRVYIGYEAQQLKQQEFQNQSKDYRIILLVISFNLWFLCYFYIKTNQIMKELKHNQIQIMEFNQKKNIYLRQLSLNTIQ